MDIDILIKILMAALLGGMIGLEREYQNKSAGLRTLMLIAVGSCLFTILSKLIGGTQSPDRIASNIVTGIGFLGAGVFFRSEIRIIGITTAASIWVVAAVGMAVGEGQYLVAILTSVLIIGVLTLLNYIERVIDTMNNMKRYKIECLSQEKRLEDFENLFLHHNLRIKIVKKVKTKEKMTGIWEVHGNAKNHDNFIEELSRDKAVECFEFESPL